jgi:adenosine deaminase CECR1
MLADYEAQRASLIDEDRSLRREFLRTGLYSDKEKEADKILRAIRASEAASIWNEEYPSIPHPFPGMEFLTGTWVLKAKTYFNVQSNVL